jgi:hypothetical protein
MNEKPHLVLDRIENSIERAAPSAASRLGLLLACALGLVAASSLCRAESSEKGLTEAQKLDLSRHFGFGPLEVFKIDHGIDQLRLADFNNDGLTDMVVSNNSKSTIEVLLQRADPPDEPEQPLDVNDLISHWRFERNSTSVTWRVDCLRTGEITGDENVDLIFFGEPKELVVLPGRGDGTFDQAITRRVRDGVSLNISVDVGDLNGDGRLDVALLAESDVVMFFQREDGGLGPAHRSSHALSNLAALRLIDINGDKTVDMFIFTQDDEYPVQMRLQDSEGNLGPVQQVKLPGLRSILFATRQDSEMNELFAVERVSGRLKRWTLESPDRADESDEWAVLFYPLPSGPAGDQLPLAVADVDGDGLADLVSADVEAAQLVLFRQQKDLGLLPSKSFGGQMKMRDMR